MKRMVYTAALILGLSVVFGSGSTSDGPETTDEHPLHAELGGVVEQGGGPEPHRGAREGPGGQDHRGATPGGEAGSGNPEGPASGQSGAVQPPRKDAPNRYDSRGRPLYKPGEILVWFNKDAPAHRIDQLHRRLGSRVLKTIARRSIQRIRIDGDLSVEAVIDRYMASGLVEIAEKHALRYPSRVPNDPRFHEKWGLLQIRAPEAWEITRGDPGVVVAVIDTGVDYLHPDLRDNMWVNTAELNGAPGVDDDGNGYVDDVHGWDMTGQDPDPMDFDGHGAHVAGIIAARGDNGIGVVGVNWVGRLMALKVTPDDDDGMDGADIIAAIGYAIDNGASVVNCSFGGEAYQESEKRAFQDLAEAGILAVCAAGNAGNTINPTVKEHPAAYDLDNIISVAASAPDDALAPFSSYGLPHVDVMAPGVDITSTAPHGAEVAYGSVVHTAFPIEYAGLTGEDGITGLAYDCGLGHPEDFPGGVSGYIAVIQRGTLYFSEKVNHAQSAGAIAAIVYNNVEGNFDNWTLGARGNWIPAVGVSKAAGESFRLPAEITVKNVDGASYQTRSGSSMAAAMVSGVAALLRSINPGIGYSGMRSAILDTVDKIDSASGKVVTGGRINARAALGRAFLRGDVSRDNSVALDDAIMALRVLSGQALFTDPFCVSCGVDVDGDSAVGLAEAIYVIEEIAGVRPEAK